MNNTYQCARCNTLLPEASRFCPNCGQPRQTQLSQEPQAFTAQSSTSPTATTYTYSRNKYIACILALVFGGFGAHYFYLGKMLPGILSILFCWTFIPSIIAFIMGFCYLGMSDEQFNQKFNL